MDFVVNQFNSIIKKACKRFAEILSEGKSKQEAISPADVQILFSMNDDLEVDFWVCLKFAKIIVPRKKGDEREGKLTPLYFNELLGVKIDILGRAAGLPYLQKIMINLAGEYNLEPQQIVIISRHNLEHDVVELYLYDAWNKYLATLTLDQMFEYIDLTA